MNSAVKQACVDLGLPDLTGLRRYGDEFLHAWFLMRYLACGKQSLRPSTWVLTIPRHLLDIVAHIRRSLTAIAADASQGYDALAMEVPR